jgi:hypothetical protein
MSNNNMLDEQYREIEATAAPVNLEPEINFTNAPSKLTQLSMFFLVEYKITK